jgi:hypothetical protein
MLSFIVGGVGIMVLLLFPLFVVACLFWLWMLISAIQNQGLTGTDKVVWVLVILFLHFVGAFLDLLLGYSKRLNQKA